jgi:chromosome segregation ATPase
MAKDNELLRLERHIEQLLQRFAAVRDENRRLEGELSTAVADNEQLRRDLGAMTEERQEMTTRVDSLIDRIEKWQTELPDETVPSDAAWASRPATKEDHSETDEQQTTPGPETGTEVKQERDSGIQGSLFSR